MEDIIELSRDKKDTNVLSNARRVTEEDYWEGEAEAEERYLQEYGGIFAIELTIRRLYGHSATFEDVCVILNNQYPDIDRKTAITIAEQIKAKAEENTDKILKLTPQRLTWVMRWANTKSNIIEITNSKDRTHQNNIRQLPNELVAIKPYLDAAVEVGLVDENYQPLEGNTNRCELAAMIWYIYQYHKVKYIWKLFQDFWQLAPKINSKVKSINLQHQKRDTSAPRITEFINKIKNLYK